MAIDWTPFVELVERHYDFVLTTHVRPDGDGIGSMLALADILERKHKQTHLLIGSVFPGRYQFLDPGQRIERLENLSGAPPSPGAVIILDTGTWNQLGPLGSYLRSLTCPKVVIDHHPTQDDLGAVRFVDTTVEATGRLVHQAITALGDPLTERAATALFVALAMDTGWFRHSNMSAATFALAAELLRAGARPEILYDQLFENSSLPRLKLLGLVLDRLQLALGGRVAYTEIRRADYPATGALPQDSEDMVNFSRGIAGVEVGLLFMEQPRGGIKVSLRSRSRIDVGRVAEQFGGGGHRLASGAIVQGSLEEVEARVLETLAPALDQHIPTSP
jgi:phosphoesterase RecJ-like protein